jgi:hypothetical protein
MVHVAVAYHRSGRLAGGIKDDFLKAVAKHDAASVQDLHQARLVKT